MRYLLDTNILLHLIRRDSTAQSVVDRFSPLDNPHQSFISAVSVGEIESIAMQRQWSLSKQSALFALLGQLIALEIYKPEIIRRYAEIDAFSQGNLPGKPLNQSARNMGKNDLWIAATASVLGAKLLSTDAGFDHLDGVFLDLERIVPHF